jgi:hypothetical protein
VKKNFWVGMDDACHQGPKAVAAHVAPIDFCPPSGNTQQQFLNFYICCKFTWLTEVTAINNYKASPPPAVRPVAPPGGGGIGSGTCGTKCLDCKGPGMGCTKCATGYVPNTGCKARTTG